ncbi:sensor histidine kinase [Bacillus kwashiorkori]|uniref:sensor histidine kinase n=1 Tax=Bacillus kwashiorkori TaxID=1522318 RepID=UPI0007859B3E|nr:sensor histidine kinase [Bacillus kwashiorkori]
MRKNSGNLTIKIVTNFLFVAIFISILFFVGAQVLLITYKNQPFTMSLVLSLSAFVFLLSVITSIYYGYRTSIDIKVKLQKMITFTSSLRRGKFSDKMIVNEQDELGILAKELNNLATILNEQLQSIQRLADEKTSLRQQIHTAAVMEERQRLARELHDSVSQQLFALSMLSAATEKIIDKKPELVPLQMKQITDIAAKAQGEMRALLLHLRPIDLSGETLSDGILSLVRELKGKTNLHFEATIDEVNELPKAVEEHLFRIVQEAISNILRHSNADTIILILTERNNTIYLHIGDNGVGFDMEENKKISYGLKTMRERCEEIGGIFSIRSKQDKGTYIDIKVPISQN